MLSSVSLLIIALSAKLLIFTIPLSCMSQDSGVLGRSVSAIFSLIRGGYTPPFFDLEFTLVFIIYYKLGSN